MNPELIAHYNQGIEQYTVPVLFSICLLYLYAMYTEYKSKHPK